MSNLDHWGKVTVRKDEVNTTKYIETVKKYWKGACIIGYGLYLAVSQFITYMDTHPINPEPTPVPVVQPEIPDSTPKKLFNEAVSKNEIQETPHNNELLSKFSHSGIQAELVVPSSVDVYKLVKIKTDKNASFYDVMVMTVYKNNIVFIDTVPTSNKGEWVFTGPPGQYAVRLSAYDPTNGVTVETGNVIIGEPAPPPPPPVAKVAVPNFTGNQFGDSQSLATAIGLVLKTDNPDLKGIVISQDVVPKTLVDVGSSINVIVKTTVPPPPPAPPVFTEKYGFSTFAYNEVMTKVDADSRATYKDKLASNFEAIAAKIAAGAYDSMPNPIASSQQELAGMNRLTLNNNDLATVAKWVTFYTDWSAKATAQNKDGTLPNLVSEYAIVYKESATGLRAAK